MFLIYKAYEKFIELYGDKLNSISIFDIKAQQCSDAFVYAAISLLAFKSFQETREEKKDYREEERIEKLRQEYRSNLKDLDEMWREKGYIRKDEVKPWFLRKL